MSSTLKAIHATVAMCPRPSPSGVSCERFGASRQPRNDRKHVTRRPLAFARCLAVSLSLAASLLFAPATSAQVVAIGAQANMVEFPEEQFRSNVFGRSMTNEELRRRCDHHLRLQISHLEQAVTLSDEQRDTIRLAGLGDIERFLNDFNRISRETTFGSMSQDEWQQVWQKISPLRARFQAGLHSDGSLLAKTTRASLEPDQFQAFEAMEKARHQELYQRYIDVVLTLLDRNVPLTSQQRQQIAELMLQKTEPPELFGSGTTAVTVVLVKLASLQDQELKPIFTETEWPTVRNHLMRFRAMRQSVERQLEMGR